MPSNKPTDEILAALPKVGLRLLNLGEHAGADRWGCMLATGKPGTNGFIFDGQGATPAAALIAALKRAGVDATDDSA